MSDLVESYAEVAISRWQQRGGTHDPRGRGGPHDPRFCGCIVCADGRQALGLQPLVPLFARRDRPEPMP